MNVLYESAAGVSESTASGGAVGEERGDVSRIWESEYATGGGVAPTGNSPLERSATLSLLLEVCLLRRLCCGGGL